MKKTDIVKYAIIFIVFGFLGWLFEQFIHLIFGLPIVFEKIGAMFGLSIPFLPIYGLGAIIVFLISDNIEGSIGFKGFIEGTSLMIFEFISGLICIAIFGKGLWDYSTQPGNIFGIISIWSYATWTLLCLLFETMRKKTQ